MILTGMSYVLCLLLFVICYLLLVLLISYHSLFVFFGSKRKKQPQLTLSGNVQVSNLYLGITGDVAIPSASSNSPKTKEAWKAWASASQKNGTPAVVQLNHPGRQSPAGAGSRGFWTKNIAPSAVKLVFGPGWIERMIAAVGFGTPRAMVPAEIEGVINMFVDGAKVSEEAGFKGVQIHAA